MASWRPPGSILEASGLPFGGSGPDFRRLWTSYLEPRTPRTPKNLQKQKLHHKVARPPKGGWAAVIPPGGFQSAAHRRCAGRARPQSHRLQPKLQIYQQMAKFLMACSSSCFEGSYTPLFFSPQEPGDHRRPCAKKRKNGTLWLFFSIFCFSKLQSKFCTEKTSKKVGKSMVFATQTPPKTRTKSCFCCKQRFLKNRAPA